MSGSASVFIPGPSAFDSAGAQIAGTVGCKVYVVTGPASYAAGGVPVDCSDKFSRIIGFGYVRQYTTASPSGVSTGLIPDPVENAAGGDTFANAKFRLMLLRVQSYTPSGTVSAPTITTATNATPTAIGTAGGALAQVVGASGITGIQAPTFTGVGLSLAFSEVGAASAVAATSTYEILVWGILK
ncbi:MAG: hypothetical protein QOG31_208 [Thermoplasmata archaeon]|jgi:hypothetical protein|nr:hypothetical protein [Thermoplasmata archaeon]